MHGCIFPLISNNSRRSQVPLAVFAGLPLQITGAHINQQDSENKALWVNSLFLNISLRTILRALNITSRSVFLALNILIALNITFSGDIGPTGIAGPGGPSGPQGLRGPEGKGLSGVRYNRWGRTNCAGDASVVYTGR